MMELILIFILRIHSLPFRSFLTCRFMRYKFGCYTLMLLGVKLLAMLCRHVFFPLLDIARSRTVIALLSLFTDTIFLAGLIFIYPSFLHVNNHDNHH